MSNLRSDQPIPSNDSQGRCRAEDIGSSAGTCNTESVTVGLLNDTTCLRTEASVWSIWACRHYLRRTSPLQRMQIARRNIDSFIQKPITVWRKASTVASQPSKFMPADSETNSGLPMPLTSISEDWIPASQAYENRFPTLKGEEPQ